jgi:branched-chain amino acid aminotransferase
MQEAEKIWMNGELVDWPDARVHVLSHGLHYGTSVFEGIRSYDAQGGTAVFRLDDHLQRLERSAAMYHMPLPYTRQEMRAAVHQVISSNGLGACYIRPIALRGYGTMGLFPLEAPVDVAVAAWEWGAYLGEDGLRAGIRAKVASWRRIGPTTIPATAKAGGQYLNSILAKIETHKAGYQEAILLNEAGYVADGSGENIFLVRDGVLITPPLYASILEGITRASIITLAGDEGIPVVEREITRGELYTADEVFVTGTAAEVCPINEIDDHPIGVGPVTRRLQDRFFAATEGRDPRSAAWLDFVVAPAAAPVAQPSLEGAVGRADSTLPA